MHIYLSNKIEILFLHSLFINFLATNTPNCIMSSSNTSTTQRIIDDAAKALLYHSTIEPTWTQLPKPIKLALCKRANIHLRFIHDKLFQQTLHDIWNKNYKHHLDSIKKKNTIHLECSICLESRPIDGINHTSTLLCGHHFCSQCIFKHIHTRGDNASCPMCRSQIFHTTTPIQTQQTTNPIIPNNRIQIRRQHERWTKRQRKRLNQTTLS